MSEQVLVEQCSPTMAGLKTASLFRMRFDDEEAIRKEVLELDRKFRQKGLRVTVMRYDMQYVLLYIYRPLFLARDLKDPAAAKALRDLGYETGLDPSVMVDQLTERIRAGEEFPHEIGFFLGYPVEDVIGFMYHRNDGCKKVGYWKVYGNLEKADALFAKYDRCTNIYRNCFRRGRSIMDLTVNTASC